MLRLLVFVFCVFAFSTPTLGFWEFLEDESNWSVIPSEEDREVLTPIPPNAGKNVDTTTAYERQEDYDAAFTKIVPSSTSDEETRTGVLTIVINGTTSQCAGASVTQNGYIIAPARCFIDGKGNLASRIIFDAGLTDVLPTNHREFAQGVWMPNYILDSFKNGTINYEFEKQLANSFALVRLSKNYDRKGSSSNLNNTSYNAVSKNIPPGHQIEINGYPTQSGTKLNMWKSNCHISSRAKNDNLVFNTDCSNEYIMYGSPVFDNSPHGGKEYIGYSLVTNGETLFVGLSDKYLNGINLLLEKGYSKTDLYTYHPVEITPRHRYFIENKCNKDVLVAMRYGLDNKIETIGWFKVPAKSALETIESSSRYIHIYAKTTDGATEWKGADSYQIDSKVNQRLNMIKFDGGSHWRDSVVKLECQ